MKVSNGSVLIIISRLSGLCKGRNVGSWLVWCIQVCVNATPKRKDIISDFRDAAEAGLWGWKAVPKQFGVQCSTQRKAIYLWGKKDQDSCHSSQWKSQQIYPKIRQYKKPKELHCRPLKVNYRSSPKDLLTITSCSLFLLKNKNMESESCS